jgi:hypothetical protein
VTNPSDVFSGIRLKLTRARNEIEGLHAEFDSYLDSQPYRPGVDFDPRTRILTLSANIQKASDPMWGVQVGEIVHNLRSALDHVVWELVILTTGRPPALPTKNQFPIFKSHDGFRTRGIDDQLRCVRQDAVDLIQSEQPYRTGNYLKHPLWHLQELSNIDKHRTLHITGTMLQEFQFNFPPPLEPLVTTEIERATIGPIQQDAVLWRGHLSGTLDWPFAGHNANGYLTMGIAFDKATPVVGGWLVVDTLADIADRTNKVLDRIASEIFKLKL